MEEFDSDLHIHSIYSIGVSSRMTIPNIVVAARKKGIAIIGTGDATQPDWLNHLRQNLNESGESLIFAGVHFVLTVELEDSESIHHLVLLPDFESVELLRQNLKQLSPNIDQRWGGRPRVNANAETLTSIVNEVGGLIGPAHAFTPYRSVFREGKYESLSSCYGKEWSKVHFVELGLSADTTIADCIPELRRLTFITSSDAHSPSPAKLGREFVRFYLAEPTYDEVRKAILRKDGRKPILNVGLDPRLGKYYLSFCSSCRRTIVLKNGEQPPHFDNINLYFYVRNEKEQSDLLRDIHQRKLSCPACGKLLRLGVRDRAFLIGNGKSRSPQHRPPYLHMPPLLELIRAAFHVKSTSSRKVQTVYEQLVEQLGPETHILTKIPFSAIERISPVVAEIIRIYRDNQVEYIPGGGGRYGQVIWPWQT